MVYKCVVWHCHSRYPMQGIRLFQFPKDIKRSKIWAENCGILNEYEGKLDSLHKSSARICSLHFENFMFTGPTKGRLNNDAIPTLRLKSLDERLKLIENELKLCKRMKLGPTGNIHNKNCTLSPAYVKISQKLGFSLYFSEFGVNSFVNCKNLHELVILSRKCNSSEAVDTI